MKISILIFFLAVICCSCSKDADKGPESNGFDRGEMLNFYTTRQIIPAYQLVQAELRTLKDVAHLFAANPDSTNLQVLRSQWEKTYEAWLLTAAFQFGPAGEEGLRKTLWEETGIFPVSKIKIDNILATGVFNLSDFNRDARGFLAIEYLIFDPNPDTKILLTRFENVYARQYLVKLCEHSEGLISHVLQTWETSYKKTFIEDRGTGTGSSTAMLYNEFVKSFEFLKNMKLGLPLGKRPGQTSARPDLAEAVFSGHSLKMMKLHFQTLCKIWNGTAFSEDGSGPGFKAYLMQSEGGPALVGSTEAQIQKVHEAFAALPAGRSFSDLLATNDPGLEKLHTEMQKLTRFFKSDMSSVLGIAITYSSGDGD